MKVLTLTREYPPNVYGGAGVHVDHLTRELAKLMDVDVRCFGEQEEAGGHGRPAVRGYSPGPPGDVEEALGRALEAVSVGRRMAADATDADVVHCHTWYSMMGGLLVKLLYGIPLVVTTHSLEPLRPWKREQLEHGYDVSSWIEKTAIHAADRVVAVSEGTRRDVLECYDVQPEKVEVIYNGIDLNCFQRVDPVPTLEKYGVPDDKPYILFVGRITRQKGVAHLVRALSHLQSDVQAVLRAGAPDTPEIALEIEAAIGELQASRPGVHWVREMVEIPDLVAFYSGAELFACPSIYEPFGIINLEAMATGCPVVATDVGGIPEVVVDGETGCLIPMESRGLPDFEPVDPERFAKDFAAGIDRLLEDDNARERMARAGRERVEQHFSWETIARRTQQLYTDVTVEAQSLPTSIREGDPA